MRKLDVDVHIERDGTCDITIWNIPQDPWKEIKRALRKYTWWDGDKCFYVKLGGVYLTFCRGGRKKWDYC